MILINFACLITVAQSALLAYKGVDWSSVIVEEAAGIKYQSASGTTESLETILKSSGVNTVRQRLWVNPVDGNYNLAYNLKLGSRATAAGLSVYLDIHFSDTWADPGHQAIPAGWPTDLNDLVSTVYNYTLATSNSLASESVNVSIISIGNEIRNGLLWPVGESSSYPNMAKLLHAASAGIKASNLSPQPEIMIHLDNGWDWAGTEKFYTNVLASGDFKITDFDIMGFTYYPFYGSQATLAALKSCTTNMGEAWPGKKYVIAETDWPLSCPDGGHAFPADVASIPYSAEGQGTYISELAGALASVSGGSGLFYWEPAWVQAPKLGSSCANNLMFSADGQALSSLSVFGRI